MAIILISFFGGGIVKADVISQYKKAKTVLLTVSPFIASLLNKARVIATEAIPTAAVDTHNNILINPEFFSRVSFEAKVFILAHETLHWAFLDPKRSQSRDHKLWNFVADAVNNEVLLTTFNPAELSKGIVTLYTIKEITGKSYEELLKMTKEELYKLLENELDSSSAGSLGDAVDIAAEVVAKGKSELSGDLKKGALSSGGTTIQEGSSSIYSSDDVEAAMKQAIAEAEQVQKSRGVMPAGLQRLVDAILRPKIPWKTLLRQTLKEGLGKTSTMSWKKLSRRHKDYPGKKRLTTPTVWVGIDTSGSINGKELEQFLGEVYGIAKASRASIVVIPWDSKIYEPIKITRMSQVRGITTKLKGGGGTNPTEFLRFTVRNMKPLDAVIILSDGYIGYPDYYKKDAINVTRKASTCIFVTTGEEVEWPKWKLIKLEL